MIPTVTREATHKFTAPANWKPELDGECGALQVRAQTFGERGIVELVSTWKPTPDELARLNRGGVIEVGLCTGNQPAMCMNVVDPVPPALVPYVPPQGA